MIYRNDSRIKPMVEMSRTLGRTYRTNPDRKTTKIKQTLLVKNNNRIIIIIIENPRKYQKTLKLEFINGFYVCYSCLGALSKATAVPQELCR